MSSTSKRSSASSTPTKRLIQELSTYNSSPPPPGLIFLAPISSSNLFSWRAIVSGAPLPPSTGYTTGRWLLHIAIPESYPQKPPEITFVTKICHPNIKWETGEVCLDVLKENWTPILGVVGCLEAVIRLLGEPGTDSPLGVEVAALLRQGDGVGARGLVGFWCGEERFEGLIEEER